MTRRTSISPTFVHFVDVERHRKREIGWSRLPGGKFWLRFYMLLLFPLRDSNTLANRSLGHECICLLHPELINRRVRDSCIMRDFGNAKLVERAAYETFGIEDRCSMKRREISLYGIVDKSM